MIYFFDADGECVAAVDVTYDDPDVMAELVTRTLASSGAHSFAESPERMHIANAVVRDGVVCARPSKPSKHHKWSREQHEWIDPRSPDELAAAEWASVREKRDQLLAESDWVTLRALDSDSPVPAPWRVYRKKLRDITTQLDPFNITWPEPPKP